MLLSLQNDLKTLNDMENFIWKTRRQNAGGGVSWFSFFLKLDMPGTIQTSNLIPPTPILINVLCLTCSSFGPYIWEFLCYLRDSEIKLKQFSFQTSDKENRILAPYLSLK